jgi:inorganic pyrophosphatase
MSPRPPPRFQAHPWHGISPGDHAPEEVTAYIEIVPTESVKYELDKASGHLKVDRPQRLSSACPTLYGFVPQTYCAREVARLCERATGRTGIVGDGDPMDICVVTETTILHGGFLLRARPIGGFRMLDGNEADDKVIAVLPGDVAYGDVQDLDAIPPGLVDRLRHYFLTYKQLPEEEPRRVEIAEVYGRATAHEVIRASVRDYRRAFGGGGGGGGAGRARR